MSTSQCPRCGYLEIVDPYYSGATVAHVCAPREGETGWVRINDVPCPYCRAPRGRPCRGKMWFHVARTLRAREVDRLVFNAIVESDDKAAFGRVLSRLESGAC